LETDRAHGLEQAFHHGVEHFVRLQVQRRQRQSPVLAIQEVRAQHLQTADRPVEQRSHDRFGGLVPGQGVQVALDRGGGGFFGHDESFKDEG
jgi:hypothetical protein